MTWIFLFFFNYDFYSFFISLFSSSPHSQMSHVHHFCIWIQFSPFFLFSFLIVSSLCCCCALVPLCFIQRFYMSVNFLILSFIYEAFVLFFLSSEAENHSIHSTSLIIGVCLHFLWFDIGMHSMSSYPSLLLSSPIYLTYPRALALLCTLALKSPLFSLFFPSWPYAQRMLLFISVS